jgi:hypothetical protein
VRDSELFRKLPGGHIRFQQWKDMLLPDQAANVAPKSDLGRAILLISFFHGAFFLGGRVPNRALTASS